MLNRLFKPRPAKAAGEALYAAAARQARSPRFYAEMGVPDTREGRFELYSLHVVLVLDRLKGQGPQADETAQILMETYIRGLDDAFRELGVGDTAVAKRVKKLVEAFYGRAKALQEAFVTLPQTAPLTEVISRTVFESGEGDAEALAGYVVQARDRLSRAPLESLLAGKIDWETAQ
jgi:cytochrome b pre-mRNA-processing protein 3